MGKAYESLRPASAALTAGAGGSSLAAADSQQPSPLAAKENEGQPQAASAAEGQPSAAKAEADIVAAAAAAAAAALASAGATGSAVPAAAKKEKAPKGPKAPVARSLLRAYLLENARQEGPEHAAKAVWVVKPELTQRFGLPTEVPEDIQAVLAASVKAPKKQRPSGGCGGL